MSIEIEEAFDAAAKARDEAGFVGTPADCIRYLDAEVRALSAQRDALAAIGKELSEAVSDLAPHFDEPAVNHIEKWQRLDRAQKAWRATK